MPAKSTHKRKKVTTAVRLPEDIYTRLTEESEQRDLSISLMVTRAVERYLASLRPIDDEVVA